MDFTGVHMTIHPTVLSLSLSPLSLSLSVGSKCIGLSVPIKRAMTAERKAFIISCTVSGSFYGGIEHLAWQDRFHSTDKRGHCCQKPLQKKQILNGSPQSIVAAACCYLLHSLPLHSVRWPLQSCIDR